MTNDLNINKFKIRAKNQQFLTVGYLGHSIVLASSDLIFQNYILGLKMTQSPFCKCTMKGLPQHERFLTPRVKANTSLQRKQHCQKQLNPSKTQLDSSWVNFTLLTPHLFNSSASGAVISTGLHNNTKTSPTLHQHGNSEPGSH